MNLEDAFHQAIIDTPHDDAPRLIYADWLDDQGQAERAEFIRVQCRLAELPTGHPDRPSLEQRERQVSRGKIQTWRKALPPRYRQGVFFRGFVVPSLLVMGDRLTRDFRLPDCAPLWAALVRLNGLEPASLAEHPVLNRLIHLRPDQVSDSWLQGFVESPRVAHLKELSVSMERIGRVGVGALAQSPYLAGLTALDLSNNTLGVAGGQALAASPHLRRLRRLELRWASLHNSGIRALADSPVLDTVVHLDLCGNRLTDSAADILIESPHLEHIRKLDLAYNIFSVSRRKSLRKRFGKRVSL